MCGKKLNDYTTKPNKFFFNVESLIPYSSKYFSFFP